MPNRKKVIFFIMTLMLAGLENFMPASAQTGCGLADSVFHKPAGITLPARGSSFIDPVFGCKITRLSDAAAEGQNRILHQYSSVNPFNADSTLLVTERDGGYMDVRDLKGNIVNDKLSSAGIVPSANPVWSRTDPNLIYFHTATGNQIKSYNIATRQTITLKTFSQYSKISFGNGEGDISYDGDHLPILAEGGKIGFVYTISTGASTPAIDLTKYAGYVDNADVLPSNSFAAMHLSPAGVELFDATGSHVARTLYEAHADRGRDVNGSDLYVLTNSADATPIANCQNGIVKATLPGGSEKCLQPMSWDLSVHISCNNYDQGWCLVSTYSSKLNPDSKWPVYARELLKVNLDGSGVTRLAHSRSTDASYNAMPRAAVSPNGQYVIFDSDMSGRIDSYLLEIDNAPQPVFAPIPLPNQSDSALDSEEWKLLELINNYRAQNGVGALQASAALTNAAHWMSSDMAAKNYMSHTDSLGRSSTVRMTAFGYGYSTWKGENIFAGNSSAQTAFDWWAAACDPNSTGACTYAHRKNMLNSNYKVIGIDHVSGRWTTDFGGFVDATLTNSNPPAVHSPGTLVLSGGTVWRINDAGTGRQGIDSLVKFQSHRFKFASVVPANSQDMALPDTGLLGWGHGVLFNHNGTVYQISGSKHGFTSAAIFLGLGFNFENVILADLTNVPAGSLVDSASTRHLEGTLVLDSSGTVWFLTVAGRRGISSPQALFSLGARFSDVARANSYDLTLPIEPPVY